MFSNFLCRNVDLQKLIKLLTVVMSTVGMDTVRSSGKPNFIDMEIFSGQRGRLTLKTRSLIMESQSMAAWHYDGQDKPYQEDSHQ